MSDWGTLPASVKAQLDRKATMWILEAPTRPIEEVYTIGAQIGQPGQFGRAHRCVHKETGAERAVKVISKTKFTRAADKKVHFKELRLEIDILQKMNHDNIIKLHDVFETINDLYIGHANTSRSLECACAWKSDGVHRQSSLSPGMPVPRTYPPAASCSSPCVPLLPQ